jgi:CDP-diacylglycerol--serine O-phosphatidyltransferase
VIKHNISKIKKADKLRGRGREFGRRANQRIKEKLKKPIPRSVVPSFFTLMNLLCGFLAITQIYQGMLIYGAWLIVLAALFDALDGFMARLTNGTSVFGTELDSLSDVVSFGAAPGFLVYVWAFNDSPGIGLALIAALPLLCGAIRLARFNMEAVIESHDYFRGLPIPAQAMMIVGFFLTFYDRIELFDVFKQGLNVVLIPVIIVLSLLMVSTIKFDKIPRFKREYLRENRGKVLIFAVYALTILVLQEYGLMLVFSAFIMKGIIVSGITFWKDVMTDENLNSTA